MKDEMLLSAYDIFCWNSRDTVEEASHGKLQVNVYINRCKSENKKIWVVYVTYQLHTSLRI